MMRSKQFILFLLAGGAAAIVNFGSRIIYNGWMDFSSAIILAYLTGMIAAFVLNKWFVFKESQQAIHHSIFFFSVVNIMAVAQTWLISMGLFYYLFPALGVTVYPRELAHAVGVMIPIFTSYFGHKHLSFR